MITHAIRAIGIELGERLLSPDELASTYGVKRATIEASLGGMVVHVTSRSRVELARDAVTRCLSKADLSIHDIDLLISCRGRADVQDNLPLELLLGCPKMACMRLTGGCPVLFQAIWMARAWLRSEETAARRVMVVYSEVCDDGARIWGPISETTPRDIFSDAAGAVLVEQGDGLALRGYGSVEDAEWWSYAPGTISAGEELEILRDSMEASRSALQCSIKAAGFSLDGIDHFVFPNEVDVLMRFIARHLRVRVDRMIGNVNAPSHAWAVDPLYTLEQLMSARTLATGRRIACLSRGMGVAAALALEVVAS